MVRYAYLPLATFTGTNLAEADFSGTLLHGADFTNADLSSARMVRAIITQATFQDTLVKDTDFTGAIGLRASDLAKTVGVPIGTSDITAPVVPP
eukprot:4988501-Pleurochrysis_carterae.AAC.1